MGYYATRLMRLARGIAGRADPVILMYHRVADVPVDPWGLAVTPARFAAQMRALKRMRTPVPLDHMIERLLAGKLDKGAVAVTFDDAYRDVLTNALPVMREHGIPATVFVVTGKLGDERGFWWDRLAGAVLGGVLPAALPPFRFADDEARRGIGQAWRDRDQSTLHMRLWSLIRILPPGAREEAVDTVCTAFGGNPTMAPVMSREELDALIADGLISLGAHCVTHPSLPSLSDEEQRQEIGESRATLEAMMGHPIRRLAYPFGDYDERSMNIARDLGFDYAVSVETGPVRDPATRFRLPRHDIKNWTGAEFAHRLRWTI